MKRLMKLANRQSVRQVIACLMAFLTVNGPVWAIHESDATLKINAGVTTSGNTTTVDVLGSRAIVEWSNFNTVGGVGGEELIFSGNGGAHFAVLNRITGAQTQFDGKLTGNQGHIFVINPNGIVFGPTAEVTAHKFTASGMNLSNVDFMNDHYHFSGGKGAIENNGRIEAREITLVGSKILNNGTIVSQQGLIVLATGSSVTLSPEDSDIIIIMPTAAAAADGVAEGDIVNSATGVIENSGGTIVLAAGDVFAQALDGLPDRTLAVEGTTGNVIQRGSIDGGSVSLSAVKQVRTEVGSSTSAEIVADSSGNINIKAATALLQEALEADGDMTILAGKSVTAKKDLTAGKSLTIQTDTNAVSLDGTVESKGGDMDIHAGSYISLAQDLISSGSMTLTTDSDDTFSLGNFLAKDNLNLNTDLYLGGAADQTIKSSAGRVTANGLIHKLTPGQLFITGNEPKLSVDLRYGCSQWGVSNVGNIYVSGQGDIQLSGGLTGMGYGLVAPASDDFAAGMGGVSIISQNGRIYTEGTGGLNVSIEGFSFDVITPPGSMYPPGVFGVDLPFKDSDGNAQGKGAIVLQSQEDLILGPNASLTALGVYLPSSENWGDIVGPDDRPGVNFLAEDAVIGGFDRDQGVPSDVAIYAGSKGGDLTVQTARIGVWNYAGDGAEGFATVVFDAYDTVSMPFLADLSGDNKFGGFRLEVASRVCEWLSDAVNGGKLPYAADPAFVEDLLGGNDYVLRGAGQNNPGIDNGERAWVLEDLPAEPVAAPLPVLELPQLRGCPVEMQAAAAELGIPSETLQLTFRNALASNPNIQPCEACSRLMSAATILKDADGIRLAAMNQIFNSLAPVDAPFTPEVSASVVTAFAQMGTQDRQYALAAEYVDAFVQYVAVLDNDFKSPVGDAVAFALEKHGAALTGENTNPNIAAYIMAQLAPGEQL